MRQSRPRSLLVEERVLERGRSLLHILLINDHVLPHEVQESASVWVRVRRRDHFAIAHVNVDLDVVLAPLLEIVGLQVVDDRQVVDVATALRDVPVQVTCVNLSELTDQLLCTQDKS